MLMHYERVHAERVVSAIERNIELQKMRDAAIAYKNRKAQLRLQAHERAGRIASMRLFILRVITAFVLTLALIIWSAS